MARRLTQRLAKPAALCTHAAMSAFRRPAFRKPHMGATADNPYMATLRPRRPTICHKAACELGAINGYPARFAELQRCPCARACIDFHTTQRLSG